MSDHFDLKRFVDAQANSYETAFIEISTGAKRSHWMWYIFPQLAGLGRSAMAKYYGIGSIEEARAFLAHLILGRRLHESVAALQALTNTNAERVFASIDAIKLRSSLTLFDAAGAGPAFAEMLNRWFDGADPNTLQLLQDQSAA